MNIEVRRVIPKLEFLSKDEIYEIHLASLNLLEHTGVRVHQDKALKLLDDAGAEVDPKTKVVKFPQYLVKEFIKKAPSEVFMTGRTPKHDLRPGGRRTYFGPGSALEVTELRKKSRPSTYKDLEEWIILCDALPNVDFCIPSFKIQDVPTLVYDRYTFKAMVCNSPKHVFIAATTPDGQKDINEMAVAVAGGEEELRKRPIFSTGYTITNPLEWGSTALDVFLCTAEYNIPAYVISESMAGATSTMTFAGTLMQNNAEVLSGIVINQLYKIGRPCIYGNFSHIMDMRVAGALSGSPGNAIVQAAFAQLARYYNLPSTTWMCTDSKVSDKQDGYEKVITGLVEALAGSNLIWGLGNNSAQIACGFEDLVIDDEIVTMIKRITQGIEVTNETISLDMVKKVGIGGSFCGTRHTLKWIKENPEVSVADRRIRIKWEERGSKTISEVALGKAREIIATHEPEPLPKDVIENIDAIIKRAEKKMVS